MNRDEYLAGWREANRDSIRAYHREWRSLNKDKIKALRNKPKVKEQQREAARRFKKKNPEAVMLQQAKYSAKRKNVPFNLQKEDIVIPEICPVLGIPLFKDGTKGPNTPSLDRIIPELGYVKTNVIIVSFLANRIKSNATTEQIFAVANFYKELGV